MSNPEEGEIPRMKMFEADGKRWIALIDGRPQSAGWEVIQFETAPPGEIQRITFRPPGWLANASIQELIAALREGETVRVAWREE
jgi:hypothetical protein